MAFTRSGGQHHAYTRIGYIGEHQQVRINKAKQTQLYLSGSWSKHKLFYDLLVNYALLILLIDKSAFYAEQVGYLPRLYNTLVTTPTGLVNY